MSFHFSPASILLFVVCLLSRSVGVLHGAPGVSESESSTDPAAFTAQISTEDLIEASSASFQSITGKSGLFGDATKLNDGSGTSGDTSDTLYLPENYPGSDPSERLPGTYTITLDTTAAPDGFSIMSITSFAGWTANGATMANQRYRLEVATIAEPAFTEVGTYEYLPFDNSDGDTGATKMVLSDDTGATLAAGVTGIRITFLGHGFAKTQFDGTVFHELDVAGFPTLADPDIVLETESSLGVALPYAVSGSDLINVGSPALSAADVSASQSGFPGSGITDGNYSSSVSHNTFFQSPTHFPGTALYTLDTEAEPGGYDIASIESFAGWHGESSQIQANQSYTVEYSTVGSPDFLPLGTVIYTPFPDEEGEHMETRVRLSKAFPGVLASGVDQLRFVFSDPQNHVPQGEGTLDGTVVREIDVVGFAASDRLILQTPVERQVIQRNAGNVGDILIEGRYRDLTDRFEARAVLSAGAGNSGDGTDWQIFDPSPTNGFFSGTLLNVPAGGWYDIEIRPVIGGVPGETLVVNKVGVGDVYITAGQSNSANHGDPAFTPTDDRVSVRESAGAGAWRHGYDPMPIATGGGGSVWSRLGEIFTARENVPIGFLCVGVGATQVSQWVPGASHYENRLKPAVLSFSPNGFRGVLWHQGESDSVASVDAATHSSRLQAMIDQTRIDAGWSIPWYISEVSFVPSANLTQEEPVTAGQRDAVFAHPDTHLGASTDSFHLENANGGKLADSVHFNGPGLQDHADQWMELLYDGGAPEVLNSGFESNTDPGITNTGPLTDGAAHSVDVTSNESPGIIDWRILNGSGTGAAIGGSSGFFNPGAADYPQADDSVNGGVAPNMEGKHVGVLSGGTAGDHFLQTTRHKIVPGAAYTLWASIGVRASIGAIYGDAELAILGNGTPLAATTFTEADLDALAGGDASGTFTVASVTLEVPPDHDPSEFFGIRIAKTSAVTASYVDVDNVIVTATLPVTTPDLTAASDSGVSGIDNITNDNTPTFEGFANPGIPVGIHSDRVGPIGSGTADAVTGAYRITSGAVLADGIHQITASAGPNTSNPLTIVIDTAAPASGAPDLAAASDSGSSNSDDITNNASPDFQGMAEEGASLSLISNFDGAVAGFVVPAGGDWAVTNVALSEGNHSLTAVATDLAGNSAVSSALAVTIDLTAPAPPGQPDLNTASDLGVSDTDDLTNDNTPTFSISAEAASFILLASNLDGAIGSGTGPIASVTASTLPDGTHSITATATDLAGNSGNASAALSVTIDTVAPATPNAPDLTGGSDSGGSDSDNLTRINTPAFAVSGEPGSILTLLSSLDGSVAGGTGPTDTVTTSVLQDGDHFMTVIARDAAGNVNSTPSPALSVTIDTVAPAAPANLDLVAESDTGASASDRVTADDTPTVTGDAPGGTTVTLLADGTTVGGAPGGNSWTITASSISDGTVSLTAVASDAAGNASSASVPLGLTIDTTPPSVTVEKSTGQVDPADELPIRFDVVFSESVSGISAQDVSSAGSAGPSDLLVTGGPTSFQISVRMVANDGEVTVSIPADGVRDLAGNSNSGSTSTDNTVEVALDSEPVDPDRIKTPGDIPGEIGGTDGEFTTEAVGNYFGLVRFDEAVNPDIDLAGYATGRVSNDRRSDGGVFSGALHFRDHRHRLRGSIAPDGTFTEELAVLDENGAEVPATVQLDLADTPGQGKRITGTVTTATEIVRIDLFRRAFHSRKNPAPGEGRYTFLLPGDPTSDTAFRPGGDGAAYGSLDTGGVARLSLVLGDGTRTSFSAFLNEDAELQFYRSLYTGINRGFVGGILTFRDTVNVSCADGVLHWKKPTPVFTNEAQQNRFEKKNPVYLPGFDLQQRIIASEYIVPQVLHREPPISQLVPGEDNATFFTGVCDISSIGPETVSWINPTSFQEVTPAGTVSFRFNARSGFARGVFKDSTGRRQHLDGVVFQKQGIVSGNFVGIHQSGHFHIEPRGRPSLQVTRTLSGSPLTTNDSIEFGDAGYEGGFTDIGLTLANTGEGMLHLPGSPSLESASGAFSLVSFRSGDVAPGSSTEVRIRFRPREGGVHGGTLTIHCNDPSANPFVLNLTGNGVDGNSGGGRVRNGPSHTGTPGTVIDYTESEPAPFDGEGHAGKYEGLLEDSAGYLRASVSGGGGISLAIFADRRRAGLRGLFEADGTLLIDNGTYRLGARTHISDGGEAQIRGTFTDLTAGEDFTFVATRNGFDGKENVSPHLGRYTLLLPANDDLGIDYPGGDGAGVLTTNSRGATRITLFLGDGRTATASATIGGDGQLNLYGFLDRTRSGFIGGLVTFREVDGVSDCDGMLVWQREANRRRRQFPDGFTLEQPLIGSRYEAPAKGGRALGGFTSEADNADVIYERAGLDETVTATWDSANRILPAGEERTRFQFGGRSGVITGSRNDEAGKVRIRAVVFQKQDLVSGHFYFRDDQTGLIQILPR